MKICFIGMICSSKILLPHADPLHLQDVINLLVSFLKAVRLVRFSCLVELLALEAAENCHLQALRAGRQC